jgi:hypothetical protein
MNFHFDGKYLSKNVDVVRVLFSNSFLNKFFRSNTGGVPDWVLAVIALLIIVIGFIIAVCCKSSFSSKLIFSKIKIQIKSV